MTTVTRTCAKCGAKIFAGGPQEFCTACLLETGLGLLNDQSDAINLASALHEGRATRSEKMLGDFGDYELLEEVGRGGQGIVYRARQKSLNRTVALKVIGLGNWATEAHVKRFRREAEAAARLEHPGIVPIHDVGERDGSCYFSMKFVEGGQLDEVVRREPMPPRCAAELLAKVARTVHYAHEHGILHRDIKPGNILLDKKGEPHLTDFGLARLIETESTVTHTLEVLGTPSYMAPEQAIGNNSALTAATDVYALGAVLYQLLTGHPPFAGGTTYETIKLVLGNEPRDLRAWNPKIDRDLSTICLKCLEKDPKHRYSCALALAEDLEHWLKHEPIRARRTGVFVRGRKWVRRNPSIAVMAAMLLALAVPLGVMIWKTQTEQLPASNLVAPEKSIAVLPFSNLSKEPENAFFADGVQDEILTDLAKIADLKVISRASVIHYKSDTARNLREIGRQLGVANVLEGSVQRAGNRVRVNAQLLDARTERHLWAQTYDRDLADAFAIQSEIARTIAHQLQAKLSPSEEKAIQRPSTSDTTAFDLYTRAKNILLLAGDRPKAELLEAVDLLNQAVARDASFFYAYCQLAHAYDWLYFRGLDHTAARLAQAEAAIQVAARLRPDGGETHAARALNFYWGYRDYDGALAELEIASRTLPNDPELFQVRGWIVRRQGYWEEATRNLEHAIELDPRNVYRLLDTAKYYGSLRRYTEEEALLDRVMDLAPDNVDAKLVRGEMAADSKADLRPALEIIDSIRATNPAGLSSIADYWFWVALAERDLVAAENALTAAGNNPIELTDVVLFNHPSVEGVIARMTKNDAKARAAFTAARLDQEKIVEAQPNYAPALCLLGLIDAGLGRKEDALREGRSAVQLLPLEKDAFSGAYMITYFGLIAAWVGDKDLAFQQLSTAVRLPGGSLSYGELKLNPWWDPLRGDPRFEKILEEAKQPVAIEKTASSAPEQSIAVLPFENLSDEKEHVFFADSVQDDILTKLAKIADLKVISRTSVMQYRGKQNTREIGDALRVSHVLEGSVRKNGDRIHLNAQLIDTRTDTHVWAEEYDRDLSDVFAIQTEIAQKVADQLHAKVSLDEKAAIAKQPTSDVSTYSLYVSAAALIDALPWTLTPKEDALRGVDVLNQAIARDPGFFLAYCKLAGAHDYLYLSCDHTPERLALAESAVNSALRLGPNSGDAHLAMATHLYLGYLDYDRARTELAIAARVLPNDPRVLQLSGFIDRRQGRWSEAVHEMERAVELDPRNAHTLMNLATTYVLLRAYKEASDMWDRALAINPHNIEARVFRAKIDLDWRGDTAPLHAMRRKILTDDPALAGDMAEGDFRLALFERDPVAADRALATLGEKGTVQVDGIDLNHSFCEGLVARMKGNEAAATTAFLAARAQLEEVVRTQLDCGPVLCTLGLIDAQLGRKEEALQESCQAVDLIPVSKSSLEGAGVLCGFAMICAWAGERDLAFEQLEVLAKLPAGPSYGDFRLNPFWDPLRGDPRFEKIVASLAPE